MNSTEKRVPLYFMNDDTELFEYDDKINLGDIILVKDSQNVIYHVGIYSGNNKFTQTFFYPVSEMSTDNSEKKFYYIKYETVARNIIEIKNRKDIKYKEYKFPDIKMIRIPIVKYYQKDIDKILNKMFELSDYSQIKDDNEKIAYLKKDPVLFEELGFGAPIDRLVKQNFFNFNRSKIEDKILELNNIIFQD
jgi:cell wall-associated NlpC family hydrolase